MTLFPKAFHPFEGSRQAADSGFVLLEVLVSMAVFAVGIMAVLTGVLSALNLQKDSALRYRAGLILQDKLTEMVMVPYNGHSTRGLSADGVFSWTIAGVPWTETPQLAAPKKQSDRNAKDEDSDAAPRQIHQVAVDVSWQTGKGVRSIRATQLVQVSAPVVEEEP